MQVCGPCSAHPVDCFINPSLEEPPSIRIWCPYVARRIRDTFLYFSLSPAWRGAMLRLEGARPTSPLIVPIISAAACIANVGTNDDRRTRRCGRPGTWPSAWIRGRPWLSIRDPRRDGACFLIKRTASPRCSSKRRAPPFPSDCRRRVRARWASSKGQQMRTWPRTNAAWKAAQLQIHSVDKEIWQLRRSL